MKCIYILVVILLTLSSCGGGGGGSSPSKVETVPYLINSFDIFGGYLFNRNENIAVSANQFETPYQYISITGDLIKHRLDAYLPPCDEANTFHGIKLFDVTWANNLTNEAGSTAIIASCYYSSIFGIGGYGYYFDWSLDYVRLDFGINRFEIKVFKDGEQIGDDVVEILRRQTITPFIGVWHEPDKITEQFYSIGVDSAVVYTKDLNCWRTEIYQHQKIQENDLLGNSIGSDSTKQITFRVNSDKENLILLSQGGEITLRNALLDANGGIRLYIEELPSDLPACHNDNISIEIEFSEAPEIIKVNRTSNSIHQIEIRYEINLDLDKTLSKSVGDIQLVIEHTKTSDNEQLISLSELTKVQEYFIQNHYHSTSNSQKSIVTTETNQLTVQVLKNTMVITLPQQQHPLLYWLRSNSLINISTQVNYTSPEVDSVWEGAVDGPWNWSSITHQDYYPAKNKYQSLINLTPDPTGDQTGESKWVDIKSVIIHFPDN